MTAVSDGLPGTSLYVNSYERHGSDSAVASAKAIRVSVLVGTLYLVVWACRRGWTRFTLPG